MKILTDSELATALRSFRGGNSALLDEAADRIESPITRANPVQEPLTKMGQFAKAAMQGLLANPIIMEELAKSFRDPETQFAIIAGDAVKAAQFTLAELKETGT